MYTADLGHNKAQYNLALMYKDGEGVEKDYNKTFEFSKRSAEGKYYRGVLQLGICYYEGIGTSVNKQKGYELIQEAKILEKRRTK
ncbi:hypothetical protein RhiirC2_779424 [Rhizophagus irregularis]|uniref:HCP-like protein n=1 Tax=Rhizophagus irregularis TaxID=588596 RepID=A0A2N1N9N7_9GLOM|nr:hypothetical protein RhiirC2_779424 [Rhizophagus irregularis]